MAVTTFGERALTRRRFLGAAASSAAISAIARPSLSRAADRPLHHPRHPVGRCLGRFRRRLGARRPAGAHAGRGRDHRQLQRHPQRRVRRCAAGDRLHRQGADRGPAGRAGHLLPRPLPGPVVADHRRASRRSAASAPRRATGARSRSSGRATPPARAGASTRRAAACAPTRPCCSNRPGLLHPLRRQHLCRLSDPARARSCRTARSGGTSSPRRNRKVAETLAEFRGNYKYNLLDGTCAPSTPRCRCSRNGTTTRSPTTGGRARPSRRTTATSRRACSLLAARGCRAFHEFMPMRADAGRGRAHLSQDLLRPAARRVPARHAQLPRRRTATRRAYGPRAHSSARRRSPGSSAS